MKGILAGKLVTDTLKVMRRDQIEEFLIISKDFK